MFRSLSCEARARFPRRVPFLTGTSPQVSAAEMKAYVDLMRPLLFRSASIRAESYHYAREAKIAQGLINAEWFVLLQFLESQNLDACLRDAFTCGTNHFVPLPLMPQLTTMNRCLCAGSIWRTTMKTSQMTVEICTTADIIHTHTHTHVSATRVMVCTQDSSSGAGTDNPVRITAIELVVKHLPLRRRGQHGDAQNADHWTGGHSIRERVLCL